MMNGNPYGAVPEALKETRLTLRDLMAAHMENKVMEGRLGLEKSKAETELAMVGANIKRDEIRSLHDTATLSQAANQFTEGQAQQDIHFNLGQEQTTTLHREDARQRAGEFTVSKGLQERGLDQAATAESNRNAISLKELAIRQREEQRKNEVKTAAEWAQAAGISPDLLGFLGVDGQQKLKRQDADQLHGTVQAMFKTNPALGFMANGYAIRGDLTRMQEQLKDPSLLPDQAATLQKQYEAKLGQFMILDKLIMAEKAPDQAKIVESAYRLWAADATLAAKYKDFDEFSQEIQKSVTSGRGMFGDDIKKMKSAIPDKDAPINAKIDALVKTLSILPIAPGEQKRIIDKAKAANDPANRLQILQEEMGKVAQPRGAETSPVAAPVESSSALKNIAAARRDEVAARRLEDAKMAAAERAGTSPAAAPVESSSGLKNIAAARRAEVAVRRLEDAKIAAAKRLEDAEVLQQRAKKFREVNKGWLP